MAGIGLYGVYYAKANVVEGIVTGYTGGVKMMGKAISASFEPNTPEDNVLHANNSVSETDASAASGGKLTLTLDRLTQTAAADMYGLKVEDVSVTVGTEQITGTALRYKGNEESAPLGVAFIRMQQQDNVRSHEVVIYRRATFKAPTETAQTMGESIEWQTPEIEGVVAGQEGDGENAWTESIIFPTHEAGIAYIKQYLKEAETEAP